MNELYSKTADLFSTSQFSIDSINFDNSVNVEKFDSALKQLCRRQKSSHCSFFSSVQFKFCSHLKLIILLNIGRLSFKPQLSKLMVTMVRNMWSHVYLLN